MSVAEQDGWFNFQQTRRNKGTSGTTTVHWELTVFRKSVRDEGKGQCGCLVIIAKIEYDFVWLEVRAKKRWSQGKVSQEASASVCARFIQFFMVTWCTITK